jgi:hypothetical protein
MNESIIKYFTLFYEVKGGELSDRAAYERTEAIWFERCGFGKYSSWESCRRMRYRYLNYLLRHTKNK